MGSGISTAVRPAYGDVDTGAGHAGDVSPLPAPRRAHLHLVVRERGPDDGPGVDADVDVHGDADALEALEDEIVVLASHIHAAEHRLLLLVAEFDKRGGWKRAGHRNCAEWLHFRTGIARGAAREKVRAARALEKLPLTSDAMSRGELSFSKVRAITRLVDDLSDPEKPDAEAELVDVAKQVTAASLEKIVRGWGVLSGLDETELERRRHRSRYLSVAPDGEGMYVVRGKLDPEVGALLMRALDAAGDALFRDGEDWAPVGGTRGPRAEEISPRQRRADAAGLLCERAMAMGFGRRVEDADGPDDADPESMGGAVQDADTTPRDAPISGTKAERYQVVLHVDMDTLTGEDEPDDSPDASGARSHLEDGTRVSAETSRRLCCDAAVVKVTRGPDGSVLDVGRKTRTIPPAIRRALEVRDGGCRFPGCGLRFADGHHIIPWSLGGPTCLSNLVLLCPHHHRCVHEGGFTVRMRSDQPGAPSFQFHDRSGWPLPDCAPLSRLEPGAVARLLDENRRNGVDPEWNTPSATWKRDADIPWKVEARLRQALDPV